MITKHQIKAPCEIFHLQLKISSEYRKSLIKETYQLKNRINHQTPQSLSYVFQESNSGRVIASSYEIWKESKIYDLLLDKIQKIIANLNPPHNLVIKSGWAGIYKKNQLAIPHCHEPGYRSFVYYISAEKPYTPMIFNDVDLEVQAITDRLIIFPSFLRHSVPQCKGGERIILSGNLEPV